MGPWVAQVSIVFSTNTKRSSSKHAKGRLELIRVHWHCNFNNLQTAAARPKQTHFQAHLGIFIIIKISVWLFFLQTQKEVP